MHVDPELGKAAFRWALFIIVAAVAMLLFLPPGSAQYYVTLFTLAIGLAFLALVIFLVRRYSK